VVHQGWQQVKNLRSVQCTEANIEGLKILILKTALSRANIFCIIKGYTLRDKDAYKICVFGNKTACLQSHLNMELLSQTASEQQITELPYILESNPNLIRTQVLAIS
jgi:hypothetical protein